MKEVIGSHGVCGLAVRLINKIKKELSERLNENCIILIAFINALCANKCASVNEIFLNVLIKSLHLFSIGNKVESCRRRGDKLQRRSHFMDSFRRWTFSEMRWLRRNTYNTSWDVVWFLFAYQVNNNNIFQAFQLGILVGWEGVAY